MALSNSSFDGKLVNTIATWLSSNFSDVFLGNNALFTKLRMMGNVKTGGFGTSMVEPILFPDASGGGPQVTGVVDPYAELNQSALTGKTAANYIAAEYLIPVSVAQYDLDQQGSDTTKVELVQGEFENAMNRFTSKLNLDLWADPITANSVGSRSALASLLAYFNAGTAASTGGGVPDALSEQKGNRGVCNATTETLQTTIGGIQRAAAGAAYWCTPIINASDTLTFQIMSKIYSLGVRNNDHVDLIVLHRDSFDKLMALVTVGGGNGGQFFQSSKLADAGFDAIRFRGADIVMDDSVPTTCYLNGASTQYGYNILAMNTSQMKLRAKSMKPDMQPHDDQRPLKVWTGRWLGQITSKNLGRAGGVRHVNITN